jgi:hypothetical protein
MKLKNNIIMSLLYVSLQQFQGTECKPKYHFFIYSYFLYREPILQVVDYLPNIIPHILFNRSTAHPKHHSDTETPYEINKIFHIDTSLMSTCLFLGMMLLAILEKTVHISQIEQ